MILLTLFLQFKFLIWRRRKEWVLCDLGQLKVFWMNQQINMILSFYFWLTIRIDKIKYSQKMFYTLFLQVSIKVKFSTDTNLLDLFLNVDWRFLLISLLLWTYILILLSRFQRLIIHMITSANKKQYFSFNSYGVLLNYQN